MQILEILDAFFFFFFFFFFGLFTDPNEVVKCLDIFSFSLLFFYYYYYYYDFLKCVCEYKQCIHWVFFCCFLFITSCLFQILLYNKFYKHQFVVFLVVLYSFACLWCLCLWLLAAYCMEPFFIYLFLFVCLFVKLVMQNGSVVLAPCSCADSQRLVLSVSGMLSFYSNLRL